MATPEFLYAFRSRNVSGPGWDVWQSEREMFNFVSEREPAFVIAGWTTHTRSQLKFFLKDGKMRDLLEKKYLLSEIGTYFVWKIKCGKFVAGKSKKLVPQKVRVLNCPMTRQNKSSATAGHTVLRLSHRLTRFTAYGFGSLSRYGNSQPRL